MMNGAAIREASRRAARESARLHKVPFTVEIEDLNDWKTTDSLPRFSFPFLGTYVPTGWRRTDRELMFVDNQEQLESLTPGKAYAIVGAGEFQVVAEFERVS